jgi:hypothetical protein
MQRDCAYMLRESWYHRNRRNGEKDLFPWISYRRRNVVLLRFKLLTVSCLFLLGALALVKLSISVFGW